MAFPVYHLVNRVEFAEAVRHTNLLYGSINAGLLLTSGLMMTLRMHAIQRDRLRARVNWLLLTVALMIAGAQALVVMAHIMHARSSTRLTWLFALAGTYWLGVRFVPGFRTMRAGGG